jgi:hypothetical protein
LPDPTHDLWSPVEDAAQLLRCGVLLMHSRQGSSVQCFPKSKCLKLKVLEVHKILIR